MMTIRMQCCKLWHTQHTMEQVQNANTITYQLIQDALTKVRGKQKWIDDTAQVNIQKEVIVENVFREMDNEIN